MMNLVFSMLGPRLTEEQASGFAAFAQWVVLNERNGRLLVDGIGEQAAVSGVMSMLTQAGRSPRVIGGWDAAGAPVDGFQLDEAEWLTVAPDLPPAVEGGQPTRPVAFAEIHQWAGWAPKQ